MTEEEPRDLPVLRRKRAATRYRILVEIAERQPAVSQREVADALGITTQAVSDYVVELVEAGHVRTSGRGRYRVTKEGVDWLISRTDELREFTEYVAAEVVGQVDVEAAVATDDVEAGEPVQLTMRGGVLHATPGGDGEGASARAVGDAAAGEAVAVSDFEGLIDYDRGPVTIVAIPRASARSGPTPEDVGPHLETGDLLATAGTEALALARAAGREPDLRFGTAAAVPEAAARGLSVVLLAVEDAVAAHADRLREQDLEYEVVDLAGAE